MDKDKAVFIGVHSGDEKALQQKLFQKAKAAGRDDSFVSVVIAISNIDCLKKCSPEAGEAILANTNIKFLMS